MSLTLDLDYLRELENSNFKIDPLTFQKMILLYNAIEDGWSIKKQNKSFVFSKKHLNKREIFEDKYLMKFMNKNLEIGKFL